LLESFLPGQVRVVDGSLFLTVDPAQAASINRRLVSNGIDVSELRVEEQSLENVFLQLTEAPTQPSPAGGGGDKAQGKNE
jgi:ABC-2 type transport system ATP-binding protein